MRRRVVLGLVVAGIGATVAALGVAIAGVDPATADTDPGWIAWLVAICGLAVAAWLVLDRPAAVDERSLPWSGTDPIVDERPEATPRRHRLTGGDLAAEIERGAAVARERRDVGAGVAVVRPHLRAAYDEVTAFDRGDGDPAAARSAGTWTDDPVAAATLAEDISPPVRTLRQRLQNWLYPGRAVARRIRRTVDELAVLADDRVPPVAGQAAPRQIPVHEPSLAARTVGIDGDVPAPTVGSQDATEHDEQHSGYSPGDRPDTGANGADTAPRDGAESP